jgi:hypothetical protein
MNRIASGFCNAGSRAKHPYTVSQKVGSTNLFLLGDTIVGAFVANHVIVYGNDKDVLADLSFAESVDCTLEEAGKFILLCRVHYLEKE